MQSRLLVPITLNLARIEQELRAVQGSFEQINSKLEAERENLTETVINNLMAGYAYLNQILRDDVELFAPGQLEPLLELNHLVLCGTDPNKRREYQEHIQRTERHFYDHQQGAVRDLVEWYEDHREDSVWQLAAGVYIHLLSQPQLFLEGNHRTGALLMSYLLMRQKQPPFVLTVVNAKAYFDPSSLVRKTKRKAFASLFKTPKLRKQFARLLRDSADSKYCQTPL